MSKCLDDLGNELLKIVGDYIREIVRKELAREPSRGGAEKWIELSKVAGAKRRLYDAARSEEYVCR